MYFDQFYKINMDTGFSPAIISKITGLTPLAVNKYIAINNIISNENRVRYKSYDYDKTTEIIYKMAYSDLEPTKKLHVFFNFKGGTGKTSLCYQISAFFALCGFKILVIDCDPQAHLSHSLGFDIYEDYRTLYDIVVNKVSFEDTIQSVYPNLDCLPSNLSLTRLELPLSQMTNREKIFSKLIEPVKSKYDFIFVDTNPTISTLNRNMILAADELNIVCETQPYSLKGLEILINEIDSFSSDMELQINYKIIPNKYEAKTAISQEALGHLRSEYKKNLTESVMRKCEDINISAKNRAPVLFWAKKKSAAFEDICDLGQEMIKNSTRKKV